MYYYYVWSPPRLAHPAPYLNIPCGTLCFYCCSLFLTPRVNIITYHYYLPFHSIDEQLAWPGMQWMSHIKQEMHHETPVAFPWFCFLYLHIPRTFPHFNENNIEFLFGLLETIWVIHSDGSALYSYTQTIDQLQINFQSLINIDYERMYTRLIICINIYSFHRNAQVGVVI